MNGVAREGNAIDFRVFMWQFSGWLSHCSKEIHFGLDRAAGSLSTSFHCLSFRFFCFFVFVCFRRFLVFSLFDFGINFIEFLWMTMRRAFSQIRYDFWFQGFGHVVLELNSTRRLVWRFGICFTNKWLILGLRVCFEWFSHFTLWFVASYNIMT